MHRSLPLHVVPSFISTNTGCPIAALSSESGSMAAAAAARECE